MEQDWQMDGVVFLGIPEQKRLGYRIHDLLPYRSYARKNLGYLYAIQVPTHHSPLTTHHLLRTVTTSASHRFRPHTLFALTPVPVAARGSSGLRVR